MDQRVRWASILRGEVIPPGDKSISHRALILNSVAGGKARVDNFSPGADCLATVACLRQLGVEIVEESPGSLTVSGVGKEGLKEPKDVLNAGNSATTIRLLAGLLAAQPFLSIITGDESLRSRPMARLIHPLRLMGAEVWGRGGDSLAPLAIKGNQLRGIKYQLPVASAQLKSAVLIAALFAQGNTTVEEPAPSRDHTERMLRAMGAKLKSDGLRITLTPDPVPLVPLDLLIPGDISSAAFWLVAGAIHPNARIEVRNTGINPTRMGIIEVLLDMGAKLRIENERIEAGEPVADLIVESSDLVGRQIGGSLIPRLIDEIPLIAIAGCVARGTTVIRDAAELRVKETDRIRATMKELSRLGADIGELPDGLIIRGGKTLKGGECHSYHDHRLAMAWGIAGLVAQGETIIHDAEAVAFSYPGFWSDLERLSARTV
ncbi:MAG: 3-phosphoshikimate 1-carboxyvinyltransferase [Dehalococcoidia bacterium]|jgi:3-phosphoshikimate 1-carboxyvinyltransferase|nr:3-phosphoshikimate 1-carboxyvinyltransferase [Chloroflexota bacterium]MCK4242810.1 3-phosphoshikimate 1-carboxyvinyltransferase [Dehalococcoidia bacterium]